VVQVKKCSKCGQEKPATTEHFYPHNEGKYGLRPDCKPCHSARSRAYRAANRDAVLAKSLEYRHNNAEKIKAKNRAYYEANKEKCLAYTRARNQADKDGYNARLREWRRANKDKVNVWVRNRRAKLKQLSGSHSYADIQFLLTQQRGLCACCRVDIRKTFQVDHVIAVSAGGANDRSNLQLLCKPCNLKKRARDPVEFMQSRGFLL
jgi:5-methylcytosine-specific restriction endonuclease McrA